MENKHKTVEYGKYGYFFLVPFFLVFLVFQFYPLIYTFWKSLFFAKATGPHSEPELVFGLMNFSEYVFKDGSEFWPSLLITVGLWLMNFIPQILLSLLLAAWFTDAHNKLKGQGAYKVIMYMPNIITAASLAFLFNALFQVDGVLTNFMRKLGMNIPDDGILLHGWYSFFIIAFIQFWMWYGNTMIVLIAGIMGISPSLYEAAMVDGASARQQFFKITLPLLRPILQYTMVTSCIGGLQMYDIPQLFNKGLPLIKMGEGAAAKSVSSTKTIVMLIKSFIEAGNKQDLGRASAYSVVLFFITLVVSLLFYVLTSEKKEK